MNKSFFEQQNYRMCFRNHESTRMDTNWVALWRTTCRERKNPHEWVAFGDVECQRHSPHYSKE